MSIVEWKGSVGTFDDIQSIGPCLTSHDLVVTLSDGEQLPIDFSRLHRTNLRLYNEIKERYEGGSNRVDQ